MQVAEIGKPGSMTSPKIKAIAVAMCEADGFHPYDERTAQIPQSNPLSLVTKTVNCWELYERDARLFLAGMQAISFNN